MLGRIGAGETTFSHTARAPEGCRRHGSRGRSTRSSPSTVVVRGLPLSTKPSREARYRVADSSLRFRLRFVGPNLGEIEPGRDDRGVARVKADWPPWRGRAIEPVIREALSRLSPLPGLPAAAAVGGYWTRTNVPEIDLIGADRAPVAKAITYAGTIKWHDNAPLGNRYFRQLAADVASLPGADATPRRLAVSRSGVSAPGAAARLGPDDLIAAW